MLKPDFYLFFQFYRILFYKITGDFLGAGSRNATFAISKFTCELEDDFFGSLLNLLLLGVTLRLGDLVVVFPLYFKDGLVEVGTLRLYPFIISLTLGSHLVRIVLLVFSHPDLVIVIESFGDG